MGIFSKFERKVEDSVEGAASAFEKSALTPVQITKKAEKQMSCFPCWSMFQSSWESCLQCWDFF